MRTRIVRGLLMLFAFALPSSGATISVPRSLLPVTFTIPEGDLLELRFPDATFLFEGDTRLFADPGLTVLDNVIRFVNVDGLGRIYFATDPSVFASLPPLPPGGPPGGWPGPNFLNELYLTPGEVFAGTGTVIIHGEPGEEYEGTALYACITRI